MIRLQNVSKYYHSSSTITCALRKINLEFKKGEFICITGESGSGKSTLLNIISGLDTYEDGEIYINGEDTSFFDAEDWEEYRQNNIAFIFQYYNLIESFTVKENIIAQLLINGYSKEEALIKCDELLDVVGLKKHQFKKASKLSGGQKQRLSIARALAKDTGIIVADEPTGNLDSENGEAIMKLLKSISKDKLVIVVTHNVSEAEPFITRKIRLYDGEVVLDQVINHSEVSKSNKKEERRVKDNSISLFLLNIKSQPHRSMLMILLMFICSLSIFIFVGTFITNLDDTITKEITNDFFVNVDQKRLLVKDVESNEITKEMLENAKVKYVEYVDRFDYVQDINYYRPNIDYVLKHAGGYKDGDDGGQSFQDSDYFDFINNTNYVNSASGLSDNDLLYGRLPVNHYEMVVYSDDISILGTTERVYFQNTTKWGFRYLYYDIEITGILKKKTKQAYFSEYLCSIFDFARYGVDASCNYVKLHNYSGNIWTTTVCQNIIIDERLEGNQISLHKNLHAVFKSEHNKYIENNPSYGDYMGRITFKYHDASSSVVTKNIYCQYVLDYTLPNCDFAIGVSEELFYELKALTGNSNQFAVTISDYAYTDEVKEELAKKGFTSMSCYQASVAGIIPEKVVQRYITLSISVLSIVLFSFIEILLGYSLLKLKKDDYLILRMIGLKNKSANKMTFYEVIFYELIASIMVVIVSLVMFTYVKNKYVVEFFKYMNVYTYIISLTISIISGLIIVKYFSNFYKSKIKVSVLKEG